MEASARCCSPRATWSPWRACSRARPPRPPASRGGDGIAAIDGVDASSWPLVQVMQHLRGPEGSVVRLRVMREGQALELSITRAVVAR